MFVDSHQVEFVFIILTAKPDHHYHSSSKCRLEISNLNNTFLMLWTWVQGDFLGWVDSGRHTNMNSTIP